MKSERKDTSTQTLGHAPYRCIMHNCRTAILVVAEIATERHGEDQPKKRGVKIYGSVYLVDAGSSRNFTAVKTPTLTLLEHVSNEEP